MEAQRSSATANPTRLSRYRSVRRAIAQEETSAPPVPGISPEVVIRNDQIKRAPSRYRRPTKPILHEIPLPEGNLIGTAAPVKQPTFQDADTREQCAPSPRQRSEEQNSPRTFPRSADRYHRPMQPLQYPGTVGTRQRGKSAPTAENPTTITPKSYEDARLEARMILQNEQERLRRMKDQQEQLERQRRLKEEEDLATQVLAERTPPQLSADPKEKHGKVKQPRKWTIGRSSQDKSAPDAIQTSPVHVPLQRTRTKSSPTKPKEERKENNSTPDNRIPVSCDTPSTSTSKECNPVGGKESRPIIPAAVTDLTSNPSSSGHEQRQASRLGSPLKAVDVPVSAINAGERRVELRLGSTIITLPVTPSTTARDLINSASVVMSEPVDPRASILVEVYRPLDLERPLRYYERARDVMNSWDSDTHNHLSIMPESECDAKGLSQNEAPAQQPPMFAVNLYHSQRPGKWEKRWLRLRPDGQVTVSKDEHDSNARNIFHLSDFDVYMPTRKQTKKMKPPKKICFAVKSQQRSVVFENTINFVHFFSTSDKTIADRWYNAMQSWRSWYLVHVLLGSAKPPALQLALGASSNIPAQAPPSTPRSADAIPYQLGTFKPLLDFSADDFSYGDEHNHKNSMQGVRPTNTTQKPVHRQHTPPSDSNQGGLIDQVRNRDHEFLTGPWNGDTGPNVPGKNLLGRHASVRKAQSMDNTGNAFTGRGLLSRRTSTKRFGADAHVVPENTNDAFTGVGLLSMDLSRRKSQRMRPGEPLVSLSGHSNFMSGSLLQQVEAFNISHGSHLPVIDRSKGIEIVDKTGEF